MPGQARSSPLRILAPRVMPVPFAEEMRLMSLLRIKTLLVYLACNPRRHPREVLAEPLCDGRT